MQISQENLYVDTAGLEELRNNHWQARSQFSQGLNDDDDKNGDDDT